MGIMNKLLGKRDEAEQTTQPDNGSDANTECRHGTLIPRWDRVEDMGIEERVSSYSCESCGASLSPAEAMRVKAEEVERLRV